MRLRCNSAARFRASVAGLLALLVQIGGLGVHLAHLERPDVHGGALAFARDHRHAPLHDEVECGLCRELLRSAPPASAVALAGVSLPVASAAVRFAAAPTARPGLTAASPRSPPLLSVLAS